MGTLRHFQALALSDSLEAVHQTESLCKARGQREGKARSGKRRKGRGVKRKLLRGNVLRQMGGGRERVPVQWEGE